MIKELIKNSRIKRGFEDSKKYYESSKLKIFFFVFSAFVVALISFTGEYISGYKLFLLLFLGGILAPILLWSGLFIFSLFKPINRFKFGIALIGPMGSNNEEEFFSLEPYAREQNIGEIKVKFILPNDTVYDWEKIKKETFIGSTKAYFFEKPKKIELMEGVYQVKVKSSNWGEPYLLIADKSFLYKDGKWGAEE